MNWRVTMVASLLLALGAACQKAPPAAVALPAAPVGVAAPNANAAHYGSHGVSAVPTANAPPPPAAPGADDMAGHACACGATCHCGHCSGAVPGCHCKAERAEQK
jgi:hypothetical protein